jgi:serine phosphatase RsbU (regulator of sigma subunit)
MSTLTGSLFPGGVRPDGLPAALSDPDRLAALAASGQFGTGQDAVFDDLAELAAAITGCGRALITFVDERSSFWKSCVGAGFRQGGSQRPVRESFCYFLVGLGDRFIVEDAAKDPRTRDHPSLRPMKIGAWAGYPILAPGGQVLGTVCVMDENPHAWQPDELAGLGTLARAVSNEVNLLESLSRVRRSLLAAEDLARSLQDSLLPPVLRPVPGLDAAAYYRPASGGSTVVGDFYDLFHAQGSWWGAVMGDVCGKGTEAAKITALARYTVRAAASQHSSPAEIFRQLNSALLDQYQDDRFLTAIYAAFRVGPDGVLGRLCSAGHPPALIRRADGHVTRIGEGGTMLGVFPRVHLADTQFRLAPGDTLLLYTDGATEARARSGTAAERPMFGEEGLAAALTACDGLDAASVVGRLREAIALHSGDWASDDTALIALRFPGARRPARSIARMCMPSPRLDGRPA